MTPEKCSGSTTGKARENTETQKRISEDIIRKLFNEEDNVSSDKLKSIAAEYKINWKEFQKVLKKYADWHKGSYKNGESDYYSKKIMA